MRFYTSQVLPLFLLSQSLFILLSGRVVEGVRRFCFVLYRLARRSLSKFSSQSSLLKERTRAYIYCPRHQVMQIYQNQKVPLVLLSNLLQSVAAYLMKFLCCCCYSCYSSITTFYYSFILINFIES